MRKKAGMTQRVWRGIENENWLIKKIDESKKEKDQKNRKSFLMRDHEYGEENRYGRVWSF